MKKILILLLITLPLAQAAQAQGFLGRIRDAVAPKSEQNVSAPQPVKITPQEIIDQCLDLPSVETLVLTHMDYEPRVYEPPFLEKVERAHKAIDGFRDQIKLLHKQRDEIGEAANAAVETAGKQDADRIARQQTGRSADQLRNQSDKQTEAMAGDMVAKRMAEQGLGNMSLADLQALEGKSDEEIMKAMEGVTPTQVGTPQQQAGKAAAEAGLIRIRDRWAAIDREISESLPEVTEAFKVTYEEYREELNEKAAIVREYYEGYTDHKQYSHEQYAAAQRNLDSLLEKYLTTCFHLWSGHVRWMQERVKTKMADVAEYDRLLAQTMTVGGSALPSVGYDVAGQYLDMANGITMPPLPASDSNENE